MAQFKLQVYTQERKLFDELVSSIVVPAQSGYLGVLANHAPLVALLGRGRLTAHGQSGEKTWNIDGGFLEVRQNVATLLIDRLEELAVA